VKGIIVNGECARRLFCRIRVQASPKADYFAEGTPGHNGYRRGGKNGNDDKIPQQAYLEFNPRPPVNNVADQACGGNSEKNYQYCGND